MTRIDHPAQFRVLWIVLHSVNEFVEDEEKCIRFDTSNGDIVITIFTVVEMEST